MNVILSTDLADEGLAARQWCAANLHAGDSVVVVVGVHQVGEFLLSMPPFDTLDGEPALLAKVERDYCGPLTETGFKCGVRLVRHAQGRAVVEVAEKERADLIVMGKHPHGRFGGALLGEAASYVVHHHPCPVLIVPTAPTGRSTASVGGDA